MIADSINSESKLSVSALKSLGFGVWMCTGDHEITANAVAAEVGAQSTGLKILQSNTHTHKMCPLGLVDRNKDEIHTVNEHL